MEWLGTLASVMILISWSAKNEKQIRLLNMVGAVMFVIYGILIKSFSVAFLNLAVIIVHIFRIRRNSDGTEENVHETDY